MVGRETSGRSGGMWAGALGHGMHGCRTGRGLHVCVAIIREAGPSGHPSERSRSLATPGPSGHHASAASALYSCSRPSVPGACAVPPKMSCEAAATGGQRGAHARDQCRPRMRCEPRGGQAAGRLPACAASPGAQHRGRCRRPLGSSEPRGPSPALQTRHGRRGRGTGGARLGAQRQPGAAACAAATCTRTTQPRKQARRLSPRAQQRCRPALLLLPHTHSSGTGRAAGRCPPP